MNAATIVMQGLNVATVAVEAGKAEALAKFLASKGYTVEASVDAAAAYDSETSPMDGMRVSFPAPFKADLLAKHIVESGQITN